MVNIARPKHERAAIKDACKALAEWHALDEWAFAVQHMYDHASHETDCAEEGHDYDYSTADEAGADLREAQAEVGECLAGAMLMLLRALGGATPGRREERIMTPLIKDVLVLLFVGACGVVLSWWLAVWWAT